MSKQVKKAVKSSKVSKGNRAIEEQLRGGGANAHPY